ncbi:MAG: shikimate dehydrogenase [Polyangiaceae bacterium]
MGTRQPSPVTLCGSLSLHPVGLGRAMHEAAYAALGLAFVYVPFGVRSEDLSGSLAGMRALGIRGFGVSMPFKLEVMPLLDRLDPLAKQIGAVNTIVNDDGVLTGFNSDAEGAARALEEVAGDLAGARCLVLGAGGAARAVAFGLAARSAEVTIANRTDTRAESLAREIAGAKALSWSERDAKLAAFDILVNASSAGMRGEGDDASPIADGSLGSRLTVMDIVYAPIRTRLYEAAQVRGARAVHGGRMLLYQACRQFELYTGKPAPVAAMNHALERAISVA